MHNIICNVFFLNIKSTEISNFNGYYVCITLIQELRALFSQAGSVIRVFIAKDKHTNKPKGFAFVTFELRSQAEAAIQKLNGYKLDHLVLKVEWTR